MCCWVDKFRLKDETPTPMIKEKKKIEKSRSFDEAMFFKRQFTFPRQCHCRSHPVPSRSLSLPSVPDRSNARKKRIQPLPLPLPLSSPVTISTFGSSVSCVNTDSESESETSGSFRNTDATIRRSSSTPCALSPMNAWACGRVFEPRTEYAENCNRPSHPLPRPPISPRTPAGLTESNWKKGKLLRKGTFGHVYAGFHSETGKLCTITEVKITSENHVSKEYLFQLNQDIQVVSQLCNPNIVQYYGSQLGESKLLIYSEYVSGGSVQQLLQEFGPFTEQVIQNYTRKVLSALVYLHEKNIAHRDIKAANILVNPKGEVKLANIGIKELCSPTPSTRGSSSCKASQVDVSNRGNSLEDDIWSLGCSVVEMVTAKPVCSKCEETAVLSRIGDEKEVPAFLNNLSNEAVSFIKICLQRDTSALPTAVQLLYHPFMQDKRGNCISKGR